jgi:AcrR family transcriptional regulator
MTDRLVIYIIMPRVPARERNAFYESRRAELAEVALRLWAEKGFDATPVAAVADAAGVSKGTFYVYFTSKQALLEEVLRRYSLLPSIQSLVENIGGGSFEDAVHAFVRHAWRHLSEHRDLVLLALRELPSHLDQAREAVERILVPGNKLIAAYLEEQLGKTRAREISLVVAGRGLIGTVILLFLTQEILGAGRLMPIGEEEITSTIAQVFLHGVFGTKGTR